MKRERKQRDSALKIEKAFVNIIQTKELSKITVSEICEVTGLNRSTFYANYLDVYDLADKVREKLERDFGALFRFTEKPQAANMESGALKMFRHIYENQLFYKTYFRLPQDNNISILYYDTEMAEKHFGNKYVDYHIEFFKSGLNAIIKKWLDSGCKETPEEMVKIIESEYKRDLMTS